MLKMKTLTEERERFLGEAQLFPGFRSLKKNASSHVSTDGLRLVS